MESGQSSKLRKVLIEGIVIVLSILIAFALDSWWDARKDRLSLERDLIGIRDELAANIPNLEERAQMQLNIGLASRAVGQALSQRSGTASLPDSLLIALLSAPTIDPSLGALASFISSGSLAKVRDIELRSRIAKLPGLVDDALEDEQNAAELVWSQYSTIVERSMNPDNYSHVRANMGQFWLGYQNTTMVVVRGSDDLVNLTTRRGSVAFLSSREITQLVDHIKTLHDDLNVSLQD